MRCRVRDRVSTNLLRATTSRARVAASKYVRDTHAEALLDSAQRKHYHESMFHGYDFDCTMLTHRHHEHAAPRHRVARHPLPRLPLRGCGRGRRQVRAHPGQPAVRGSLDYEATAKDLQRIVKTKKTELHG
jgi:type I restriction enzyme M protein